MARSSSATRPWEQNTAWGEWASTAQLPNVSGATVQDSDVRRGDIATVTGELYVCTVPTASGATWKKIARDAGTVASLTVSDLTAGRVIYSGTGGLLSTEAGLEYDASGNILTAPAVIVSDIAATHVPYAGTAGRLKGEAAFAYTEGTNTLTIGVLDCAGAGDVAGDFTVATTKLTVASATGNTVVAGTLRSTSDFDVATTKFTVAAATGNTVVAGTLGVTSDVAVNSSKFTVAASSGNTVVAGTLGVTGVTTVTGGIAQAAAYSGAHNIAPATATSGTDTACADGTQFVSSVYLPANITLTGAKFLVGSVGGTDKVYVVLYDAAGNVLANSDLTAGGATLGTAAQIQAVAFTGTYAATGPKMVYVGVSVNGATGKLRTVPAFCGGAIWAGSVSQAHGTVAAITPPTSFTADKAPHVVLY